MKVINYIFENSFGVFDVDNFDNVLYVGSYDSCVGYLREFKDASEINRRNFMNLVTFLED